MIKFEVKSVFLREILNSKQKIMKKFYSLLLTTLLFFGLSNLQAQDKNNKWQFSFGVNAVDIKADNNTNFSGYFEVQDNWNVAKSPFSMFSVSRYIDNNLSFGVGASFNSISKYAAGLALPDITNDYYTVDAMLKYDLSNAFTIKLLSAEFEPFVGVGPGWTWFDEQDGLTGNISLGFNYWFSEVFGLTLMSEYKQNMDNDGMNRAPLLDGGNTMRWSAMLSVKFGGTDTDGDGIYDEYDECVDTPGLEEFNGCPDTDSDGIQDSEDDCPMVAGLPEYNGCPDSDGDGVSDNKDECPEVAGLVEMAGCPDSDGDGITDGKDNCPNEAGDRGNRGCPWPDSDGDTVLDKDDDCPDEPGTVANNGCREFPSDEEAARLIKLSKDLSFAFESIEFTDSTPSVLNEIVSIILKYPNSKFDVQGHTDSVGTKAFNQYLSEQRAKAVMEYLISNNILADRLSATGFGEDKPIDSNVSSDGRSNNRRVEIYYIK